MIDIDPSKFRIEILPLKAVTTAIGGSISVVDEERSESGKEVYRRIPVPTAIARAFIMKCKKLTKYLKPALTAVVYYENLVVALERHPLASMGALETEGIDGTMRRWRPACQANLEDTIKPLLNDRNKKWYFDGRYAYTIEGSVEHACREGAYLTRDGHFRKVIAQAIDLQELSSIDKLGASSRSCLGYVTANGHCAISPPIWKNLSDVGAKAAKAAVTREDDDDEDDDEVVDNSRDANYVYTFDNIDSSMSVNLNFALAAGADIGKTFGYENVEPLHLPRLMIELHTTNLPNVPKQIKATYDIGLKFTHAMAWLIGMSRKANTLDTYRMMRALMKYLTKRGLFSNTTFDAANVYIEGQTGAHIPFMKLDDLVKMDMSQIMFSDLAEQARRHSKRRASEAIIQIGGMLNEED